MEIFWAQKSRDAGIAGVGILQLALGTVSRCAHSVQDGKNTVELGRFKVTVRKKA
jgi:hypothetical protein